MKKEELESKRKLMKDNGIIACHLLLFPINEMEHKKYTDEIAFKIIEGLLNYNFEDKHIQELYKEEELAACIFYFINVTGLSSTLYSYSYETEKAEAFFKRKNLL